MGAIPDIPPLRFRNDTDFDALHFDTLDQHDVAFHVIVAKTGYRFGKCDSDGLATLTPLDPPAPLYHEDRYYDDSIDHSVRAESDLAPYKPRCDVVVVGDAYAAPQGVLRAATSFQVSLRVQCPDGTEPMPEPPHPLNPFQPVSLEARQRWRAEAEQAARTVVPGRRLIDKSLQVTGSRELQRRPKALSLFGSWKLTQPAPALRVPIRYEYAQGGQVLVDSKGTAEKRDASQHNPVGRGFAPAWYLDAADPDRLPAPQVDYPDAPFTVDLFRASSRGKADLRPAGFGFVGRAWLPRRNLVGTVEERSSWDAEDVPRLPQDFDFAYWNGAPADQQCAHLSGDERFTVVNMTPADAEWARVDSDGNSVLSFTLPAQSLFVLAGGSDDALAALPLSVDTVLIDTLSGTVELTWRLCIVADGQFDEVRLLHATTPEQLQRLAQLNAPTDTVDTTLPSVAA
jgi:hypothetical protein